MVITPPKIDILPEHLIDQIKAGEVIERPGNLIKEILENAIDAGAKKIELIIKNNGMDLISLKDDGHGMKFSDLPLAFSRHATSKIGRFEDLYQLRSFGFRGEALASISSISKIQCISKTADDEASSELRIEGGQTVFHGQRLTSSHKHGTELVIQELFYNTPARLKFIQSQQSEKTFIRKIIFSFILSNPVVEFHVKIDEGDKDIYPSRTSQLDRIKDLFPKAKDAILFSERFYENNELTLFLIPGSYKAPLKLQYLFINDRFILDKQLHRVIYNALQSTFHGDDFHYVAYFNLPPDSIDVNVHPNKTIIKCMDISKMISLLTSTIRELGNKKPESSHVVNSAPQYEASGFFEGIKDGVSLHQERHEYNMEGLFSPHNLPKDLAHEFIWVNNDFLKKTDHLWLAVSGPALLEYYTRFMMKKEAVTIPLLVSEPFSAIDVKVEMLEELHAAGAEIDQLGSDTLVLRGIPQWMNGFPLKEIIHCLLQKKSFQDMQINPNDWSQNTWIEMLNSFPIDELISKKIVVDLSSLLRERLK